MSLFMLRGKGEAWWLPTVASDSGPTEAEVAAGIKLGAAFNAIQGLDPKRNPINVPVLKYKEELQIEGPTTYENVSVTLVEDDGTGVDADALERQATLTTMAEGSDGVLFLCRTGKTAAVATKGHMIRAEVASQVPNFDMGATTATTQVNLSPSSPLFAVTVQAPAAP